MRKDCLPGIGGTESYRQRFFSVFSDFGFLDSQTPNSYWPYQKFSEGPFCFVLGFFWFLEGSFYPLDITLCLLVFATGIIQWKVTLCANSTVEGGKD